MRLKLMTSERITAQFQGTLELALRLLRPIMMISELQGTLVDKAPNPSISNVIWVLSSDICQLNQSFSNSEAAMLSTHWLLGC